MQTPASTGQAASVNFTAQILPIAEPPPVPPVGRVIYCSYNSSPASRYEGFASMKAVGCLYNGSKRRTVAPSLLGINRWTQPIGFTASGKPLVIAYSQLPEAAAYEAQTGQMYPSGIVSEVYRVGRSLACLTGKAPGSFHSSARETPHGLVLRAAFGDETYIYLRGKRGRFKRVGTLQGYHADISVYGDVAYHHPHGGGYDIIINDEKIETPHPWNFSCSYSPDGESLLYVSGADNHHSDIWTVHREGRNPRQIASRYGYSGSIPLFDTGVDFHGGSTNIPCWSKDNKRVYYTATVGEADELCCVDIVTATVTQLTSSPPGSWWSHPNVSSDGNRLVVTGCIDGIRNIYVTDFTRMWRVTKQKLGHAVAWPSIY